MPDKYDKSTGAGQKRMFYEVQAQVGQTMQEKAAAMAYDHGFKDGAAGTEPKTPGNDDYMRGYRDGKPLPQD